MNFPNFYPFEKVPEDDRWFRNPKFKCLKCGEVIQWKGQVSTVSCSCLSIAADDYGRILYSDRSDFIVCIDDNYENE